MQSSGTVLSGLEVYPSFLSDSISFVADLNFIIIISEWGLSTQFNATDTFLKKWADAQKLAYGKSTGWIVSCLFQPSLPLLKKKPIPCFYSSGTSE